MRKVWLIIVSVAILATLTMSSCNKEDDVTPTTPIEGSWLKDNAGFTFASDNIFYQYSDLGAGWVEVGNGAYQTSGDTAGELVITYDSSDPINSGNANSVYGFTIAGDALLLTRPGWSATYKRTGNDQFQ